MFSGIVESIGTIVRLHTEGGCKHFKIKPNQEFTKILIGESIAVNGVCLTVTSFDEDGFCVTAVPETLRLTNLADLNLGQLVNLERAIKSDSRIGGHFVQGHIDCVGTVLDISHDQSNAWLVKISINEDIAKYIVDKGFITLNGMSITVIHAAPDWFTVTFIPHTQEVTTTSQLKIGDKINIEVDMMGKYIEKLIGAQKYAKHN